MSLRKTLLDIARVIADEADNNPAFAERMEAVLAVKAAGKAPVRGTVSTEWTRQEESARRGNRRAAAVLDPVALAGQGEQVLREQLTHLTLEQLKDVVADYGMDTGKLVMKWKTPERIIEKIVEISLSRARKGEAFKS